MHRHSLCVPHEYHIVQLCVHASVCASVCLLCTVRACISLGVCVYVVLECVHVFFLVCVCVYMYVCMLTVRGLGINQLCYAKDSKLKQHIY